MGPISLYLLAVADSGERKTTCDAIFCPALRDWETGRRQEMSPEIAKLEEATAVFVAKKAGIRELLAQPLATDAHGPRHPRRARARPDGRRRAPADRGD